MKKVLKIVIPILLVLIILAGCAWFFLYYRTDFTAEYYAERGAKAYDRGRYSRAVEYYTYAFQLDPQNVDAALALADSYRADGNYTKVEYTLVSAIASNPDSAELYAALSKAYVEQDKLLDASKMLSSIADESVRATLDAQRPEAPVIQPESGYYNTYITVAVSYSDGTPYLSTGDDFPSIADGPYQDPITLPNGETTVTAVVVSDDGLVSEVSQAGYTIGGVVEEVQFTDPALESFVRTALQKAEDDTIYSDEVWTITEMTLPAETQTLEDLSLFIGLETLTANNFGAMDWSGLENLASLQTLDLSGTSLDSTALEAIGTLPNLQTLKLSNCGISTVSFLSNCTTLQTLDLSGNSIGDLKPLSSLTALETLSLQSNAVTDLSALSGLSSLKSLNVSQNARSSLTPIQSCTQLQELRADNCALATLEPVKALEALSVLSAANNAITGVDALASCTALTVLDLSNNQITDISALASCVALTDLTLNHNQISALPTFSGECPLQNFSANNNLLTDVSGLSSLMQLNNVDVDYNQISSLNSLASCENLVKVNAFANPITDVSALTGRQVIVNYDPTYTG